MHANTPTKLSLWDFARILGFNPLHFAGIHLEQIAGVYCAKPLIQYEWQNGDRVGREAIARAIGMAEAMIERYLGFHVLPSYDEGDRMNAIQFWQPELRGMFASKTFKTSWGSVVEAGRRQADLLEADSPIVWSASSYWQIGTVTTPMATGIDPCEIRIFYPGHGGDPTWEIRPAQARIAANLATITFKRELAVDPDLWDALEFQAADGEDDADFLAAVDIYRVYTVPDEQVNFLWEPAGLCSCGGTGCTACQLQSQAGCFYVRDDKLGLVVTRPGAWTAGTFTPGEFTRLEDGSIDVVTSLPIWTAAAFTAGDYSYGRRAESVELSYLSGFQDKGKACPTLQMGDELARAIAFYAAANLERPPCDCTVDSWEYWRWDTATMARDMQNTDRLGKLLTPNPFGTRRGMIYAWEYVLAHTLGEASIGSSPAAMATW